MKYFLNVKETGNKAGRFTYTVTDETGKVVSERKSNRTYVACTVHGSNYFGRVDLAYKFLGSEAKRLPEYNAYRRERNLPEQSLPEIVYLENKNETI